MTTRKKLSSSTPSGRVRVRAAANVLGHRRGELVEVERTPFVDALIANGHFALTDDQPAIELEPKTDPDTAQDSA